MNLYGFRHDVVTTPDAVHAVQLRASGAVRTGRGSVVPSRDLDGWIFHAFLDGRAAAVGSGPTRGRR